MDVKVFNGLSMFIYQGQKAFYLWNKINPEIDDKLIELLVSNLNEKNRDNRHSSLWQINS